MQIIDQSVNKLTREALHQKSKASQFNYELKNFSYNLTCSIWSCEVSPHIIKQTREVSYESRKQY